MDRRVIGTSVGSVEVFTKQGRLKALNLTRARPTPGVNRDSIARGLERYSAGEPVRFDDLTLDLSESTEFERKVYEATRAIPFGIVATYGQIAEEIGKPKAARAVGQALGNNPIAIVIPCHRVVASDGLGGFTGGLRWKKRLLRHEGALR